MGQLRCLLARQVWGTHPASLPASAACRRILFGRLLKRLGKLPALPRKDCLRETPKPARETRALPGGFTAPCSYFLGVADGLPAAPGAPPSSTAKVQWVSTFLSPDFAWTITLTFSPNFFVT